MVASQIKLQQDEVQKAKKKKNYLKFTEWSSSVLQEKHCPKEGWQETEEFFKWKEWEQEDIDQDCKEVCYVLAEQMLDKYEVEQHVRKPCGVTIAVEDKRGGTQKSRLKT